MTPKQRRSWLLRWVPRLFAGLGVLVVAVMLSAPPSVNLVSAGKTAAAPCRPVINVAPVEVYRSYIVPDAAEDAVDTHINPPEYKYFGPDEVDRLDGRLAYAIGCEQARTNRLTTTLFVGVVWAFATHRWFLWAARVRREDAEIAAAREHRTQANHDPEAKQS
ncbi:hypothetical protein [uncultured Gulosibacter sp.]|uniref:hypothetical protein n=1 Tax=uncultured Gulosibacter sp. TaxID=1339167 RepID=UPI002889BB2A|nr:hypothetical protein [uncultured Gulosibacter sp.]